MVTRRLRGKVPAADIAFYLEYGEGRNKFRVEVVVYKELAALREAANTEEPYACCLVFGKGPIRARLLFCHQHMSLYYVAHECVHAAYAIGRRGISPWQEDLGSEEEERIAYPTGQLVADIAGKLKELNLL